MSDLENRAVLITGASSGIGLAAARAFARARARVMLAARREDSLQRVVGELRAAGATADYQVTDVAREADVVTMVETTLARFGRIDILVNNAGYGHFLPIEKTSSEDLHRLMEVNFFGTFYCSQAVIPVMRKQGSGHIINVSSVAGKRVFRGAGGAYNASKFAMQGLTEALRMELMGSGIKVSAVCPVTTATEFFDPAERQTGRPAKLQGPVQSAEQVAEAIVDVARRPRPEVIMIGSLRWLFALNALMPGFVDRALNRFLK